MHAEGAEHGHCQLATGICFPAASAGVEHVSMAQALAGGTRPAGTSGRHGRGCRACVCVESGASRAVRLQTWQEKSIAGKPQITSFLPLMEMQFIFKGFAIKTKHLEFFSEVVLGCVWPVEFTVISLNS